MRAELEDPEKNCSVKLKTTAPVIDSQNFGVQGILVGPQFTNRGDLRDS